jgi:ABC-type transport system involved in multi-copper enzyme maturation permease subunit
MNPVLDRELRQRLRGRSAWVALTLYLVVLGLILRLVYNVVSTSDMVFGASRAQMASSAGRSIFHWLLFVMLALICFIVPGLTGGAIAGERERQTLVPLQITLLSARSIVLGKLLASLAFVVLLVIAALPFLSVSFLLGGVAVDEVVRGVGMLLVVAVAIASVSLACSSAARRTQTATVTAYGLVGMLVIGTLVVYGSQRALDRRPDGSSQPTVLLLNPFAATAEVVRGQTAGFDLSSPFRPFQDMLETEAFHGVDVGGIEPSGPVQTVPGPGGIVQVVPAIPPPPIQAVPRTTVAARPAAAPGPAPGGVREIKVQAITAQVDGPFPNPILPAESERARVGGLPFWLASLLSFALLALLANVVAVRQISVPVRGRSG